MIIQNIPNYIAWWNNLGDQKSLLDFVSKNTRRKIRQLLDLAQENDLRFVVEDATDRLAQKFFELYKSFIENKTKTKGCNDIISKLKNRRESSNYKFLSLYHHEKYLGGLLFDLQPNKIAVAYKCYPHEINGLKLPIGIAYLSDYFLIDLCVKSNIARLNHGRDRNIYGLNSNPGLAMYKLNVGCKPFVTKAKDLEFGQFAVPETNDRDILIFTATQKGEEIKNATLILYQNKIEDITSIYGALKNISDLKLEVIEINT